MLYGDNKSASGIAVSPGIAEIVLGTATAGTIAMLTLTANRGTRETVTLTATPGTRAMGAVTAIPGTMAMGTGTAIPGTMAKEMEMFAKRMELTLCDGLPDGRSRRGHGTAL